MRALRVTCAFVVLASVGAGQEPPGKDPSETLDSLLAGLGAFREVTGRELQGEVAEVGGVPFRWNVPLSFMTREELSRYLRELFDAEYPEEKARADQRTLVAFDFLAPDADLRRLRGRLLEENVAGFYDERPGRKRLYAISRERRLTAANQMILSHELRHALQDQYTDVHGMLPDSISDFDDRRLAFLSLLEGDATLVMERFLFRRLGKGHGGDLSGLTLPAPPVPGAPPVLRDQLVLPYVVGRDFAAALWRRGGWGALRDAWKEPPESTEQVLHPETFFRREPPKASELGYAPPGGRIIQEGVLGELLTRTLLGAGSEAAAAGWGGDRFRVWDISRKTLLLWRSVWDSPEDRLEFWNAALKAFQARRGGGLQRRGFVIFKADAWTYAWALQNGSVVLLSSDSPEALEEALSALQPTQPSLDKPKSRPG